MEHEFTHRIRSILKSHFGSASEDIYEKSLLLQYLNLKTQSTSRGSKSRGSFANLYAVYVLVEDYLNHGFDRTGNYPSYEGARFTNLLTRQRQLPFGSKLQNHALNHRMNQEFRKFFPQVNYLPILRDVEKHRYWFNENLLKVTLLGKTYNIAQAVSDVITLYVEVKQSAFKDFIQTCTRLKDLRGENRASAEKFVSDLLAPNVDARIFEIVSYSILRFFYHDQTVYFGSDLDSLQKENLNLYKTGRTNANDGGIDFVMRPLGRFFQVTETLDVRKYFLDIDKVERYPISFVIKSEESVRELQMFLRKGAEDQYPVTAIVEKYMSCIEEIINLPLLRVRFQTALEVGHLPQILNEIINQSRIEFNYEDA